MGGKWLKNMSPAEQEKTSKFRHEQALARARLSFANNREKRRKASAEAYVRNADKRRAASRAKHKADPNHEFVRKLRRKYDLTLAAWLALFEQQGRRCACCRTDDPGHKFGWSTDHEHGTSPVVVRGIVCSVCNLRLGMLGDHYHEAALRTSRDLEYLRRFT